jgi:hypothetical protein
LFDPYQLKLASFLRTKGLVPCGVSLSDNYAYLGCEHEGLYQADISDVKHPAMVGEVGGDAGLGMVNFSSVYDGKLFVPSSNGKLSVFSIEQGGSPKFLEAVGDRIDYNITDPDKGIICTLGNKITAFRLFGGASPVQEGMISNIETFVERGDLKGGKLALASNNGLFIVEVRDGNTVGNAPTVSSNSGPSSTAKLSVTQQGLSKKPASSASIRI